MRKDDQRRKDVELDANLFIPEALRDPADLYIALASVETVVLSRVVDSAPLVEKLMNVDNLLEFVISGEPFLPCVQE